MIDNMHVTLLTQCLPNCGTTSEVDGIFSITTSKNTVMASSRVTARDTFSPDSGGRQNTNPVKTRIQLGYKTSIGLENNVHCGYGKST